MTGPLGNGFDAGVMNADSSVLFAAGNRGVVAIDASMGQQLWRSPIPPGVGFGDIFPQVVGAALSPGEGELYVHGYGQIDDTHRFVFLAAYDAVDGRRLWWKCYAARPGWSYQVGPQVAPDGSGVFVADSIPTGITDGYDIQVMKLSAASGAVEWRSRYRSRDHRNDLAWDTALTPTGTRLIVGGVASKGNPENPEHETDSDSVLMGFDTATGHRAWLRRLGRASAGFQGVHGVAVSADGSECYVVGGALQSSPFVGAFDVSSGGRMWLTRQPDLDGFWGPLRLTPDGTSLVTTGSEPLVGMFDTGSGRREWVRPTSATYGGGYLALAPDGAVAYVLSFECDASCDLEWWVVQAFATASGHSAWHQQYGLRRRYAFPGAIVASPDGSAVFALGSGIKPGKESAGGAVVAYAP